MTEEQNKDALEMLMFIKENRDGTIKARPYFAPLSCLQLSGSQMLLTCADVETP